ncbi:snf2 family helicase [Colletotrichum musicola]|uniref:Snf2 family helicase n=1 Tax=Colletotrichum musicola TaxID=2175873 RepID=A0A8H6U8N8_9PEZI|nr:snf2 family helicase [Colletotrichum musicola]
MSWSNYIPIGCLIVTRIETGLPEDVWGRLKGRSEGWTDVPSADTPELQLQRHDVSSELPHAGSPRPLSLDETTDALFRSPPLKNIRNLIIERWIRMELLFTGDGKEGCVGRVYGLPDDIDRRLITRARTKLKISRAKLYPRLDCSPEAWGGRPSSVPVLISEISRQQESDADDDSLPLLQMFNTMPSPDPRPEKITSLADQEAAFSVLESDIPGLKTPLYGYQRRSAALMIQRESEPGQFLDPRLIKAKDQLGADFYFDPSSGTLLKEPRYYDGVRGGILAEQMGAGKTLICLSVILSTRHSSTQTPEIYQGCDVRVRKRTGTLADMAAASATCKGAPWKSYFNVYKADAKHELEYTRCIDAIQRNPSFYRVPAPPPKRASRLCVEIKQPPKRIWHSHASLVIVPNNLMQQWAQEIQKHTVGPEDPASLKVLKFTSTHKGDIPPAAQLAACDIVLISQARLLRLYKETSMRDCPLTEVHFKRCIVDEGHKLGHSRIMQKSDLLLALDHIAISARWIVTGTPSPGLYGVDGRQGTDIALDISAKMTAAAVTERQDLDKIGAIASLYLNARPWSNTAQETEDTTADWAVYVMQPRHSSKSSGQKGVLRATLRSLLVRHQLSELSDLLPTVDEKTVVLEGSYQDKLSLNIFSMMIIFNAVQSQRTDLDYFFHIRQRKALLQLLHNLKQASFFGGSFFSPDEIQKSLETAEKFLEEKKVITSNEDEVLLKQAMDVARAALANPLKRLSNSFNEVPIFIRDFLPGNAGRAWSLDENDSNPACTDGGMVKKVQMLIRSSLNDPTRLNSLLNGQLLEEGHKEMADQAVSNAELLQEDQRPSRGIMNTLAGNTKLGGARIPKHLRALHAAEMSSSEQEPPEALKDATLISTTSAKLSYLIDAVVEHQASEKIIIFYENENVAWYLATMLDVIQVPHFIYARSLSYDRKMQYINTFNADAKFRVILMDLTQAAVGLDMRTASRIYFINPVLNPQIQAQAIGRARRISQQKSVTVETLVLRGSIEEVIVERKKSMTQIEHWKCKSILDDRPIYNWILNAGIMPLPEDPKDNLSQSVPLKHPQPVFRPGFGRVQHPDQDLIMSNGDPRWPANNQSVGLPPASLKRSQSPESQGAASRPTRRVRLAEDVSDAGAVNGDSTSGETTNGHQQDNPVAQEAPVKPARQVRFAGP